MHQTGASQIRIVVADDHSLVRRELTALLRREADFEIVAVAYDSLQTLQNVRTYLPDLLLMDPMMRDGLGLATIRQIRASLRETVVVVLTAYVDTALYMELTMMGVKYILTKGILISQLLSALRSSIRT